MIPIVLYSLGSHRWPLIAGLALLIAFGCITTASYEVFGESDFLSQIPKEFSALLKADADVLLNTGPQAYMAFGFREPFFLIVICAFAIAGASGGLAREIERGTILAILATPITRYQLTLAKWLETSFIVATLVLAMVIGTFIGMGFTKVSGTIDMERFLLIGLNALCLGSAICSYSFWVSSLNDSGGKATLISTGITIGFFFVDYIAVLFSQIGALGFMSVFHYYDPISIATGNSFPTLNVSILIVISGINFVGALITFQKRDINC